jgi:TonB family protein
MFDSVLGRAVTAPGRAGTGAALSLGLHALGLTAALVLSAQSGGHTPLPIKPISFPPRPTRPASPPAQPGPVSRPTRPDAIRPRTEAPAIPATPEQPAQPGADELLPGAGQEVTAGSSCTTPPCDVMLGAPGVEQLDGPQVFLPRLLSGPEPVYPAEAARESIRGMVLVRCTVTEHGTVEDWLVLRSLPMLDGPVLRALLARRYSPARSEGHPVPVRMVFTVRVVPP